MNSFHSPSAVVLFFIVFGFAHGAFAQNMAGFVYTPIDPCRVVDTRVHGGPFAAKETRVFMPNSASSQGGGTCTVYPAAMIPSALSVNITVDATSLGNPAQYGFLNLTPIAEAGSSWMNFFGGQTIANAGVATIDASSGSFAIKTQNPANVIVDVYGYWFPAPIQAGSGAGSVVTGTISTASGENAVAMGYNNIASGIDSVALGTTNSATAIGATALGGGSTASGAYATSLGKFSVASGNIATAIGYYNTASGESSIAMGQSASTNSQPNSFIFSDGSNTTTMNTTDHQFMIRASGGTVIYTSNFGQGTAQSTGVYLSSGGGSWSSLSDRNAKDAVQPIDGSDVLDRVTSMPLATWHYKAQDTRYRHMGPMAQDFYAAFHLGESETGIDTIDADGRSACGHPGTQSQAGARDRGKGARERRAQDPSGTIGSAVCRNQGRREGVATRAHAERERGVDAVVLDGAGRRRIRAQWCVGLPR